MAGLWLIGGLGLAGAALAALAWRPLRLFGREVHLERARETFALQRERLEAKFAGAAAATGKPRGLLWKECLFDGPATLARDRQTGQLLALVPLTVQFEAVEGGGMEDVEAVADAKVASAVFFFQRGHWETAGKALFNLHPAEALERFKQQYEPVEAH
jgi:hypothetical protein